MLNIEKLEARIKRLKGSQNRRDRFLAKELLELLYEASSEANEILEGAVESGRGYQKLQVEASLLLCGVEEVNAVLTTALDNIDEHLAEHKSKNPKAAIFKSERELDEVRVQLEALAAQD